MLRVLSGRYVLDSTNIPTFLSSLYALAQISSTQDPKTRYSDPSGQQHAGKQSPHDSLQS